MKACRSVTTMLFMLVLFVLFIETPSWALRMKSITLRFTTAYPAPDLSLASYGVKLWMEEISKKTQGRVKFEAVWGDTSQGIADPMSLLESGAVDLVLTEPWRYGENFPLSQFDFLFPFGPGDPATVIKARRQMIESFPGFEKELETAHVKLIMNSPGCAYQFFSKSPISTLNDLKGKKVSLQGTYLAQWLVSCGAIPVMAEAADRCSMLQSGAVDVDLLPLDFAVLYNIDKQAATMTRVDLLIGNGAHLLMNLDRFNKLPKWIRGLLMETAKEIELRMAEAEVDKWAVRLTEELKARGGSVEALPAAELEKWVATAQDVPAQWAEAVTRKGYPGWDMVTRYQDITTEMGYRWPRRWGIKQK